MTRIRALTVRGFGVLSMPDAPLRFDPERMTLIVGPNEAGKTTLCEALFAALYGVETRRSVAYSPLPLAEAWRPPAPPGRTPPPFAVAAIIEHDGRLLRAEWTFDGKPSLRVVDESSGEDLTEDFHMGRGRYDLGRRLTGLAEEEFRKVCTIGQGAVSEPSSLEGIAGLVQRYAATAGGSGATAAEALDRLEKVLREYPGTTGVGRIQIHTELKRLEDRLAEVDGRLADLERLKQRAAKEEEAYERLCEEEARAEADLALARHRLNRAERREAQARIEAAEQAAARLAELQRERERLQDVADFPAHRGEALIADGARLKKTLEDAAETRRRISQELEPALEASRRDLAGLGRCVEATEADALSAAGLEATLRDVLRDRDRLRKEADDEERRLAAEDVLPAELHDLRRQFRHLSARALEEAAAADARRLALQERLAEAQARFQDAGKALAAERHKASRRRLLAGSFALCGVLVLMAGLAAPALFRLPRGLAWLGIAVGGAALGGGLLLRRAAARPTEAARRLAQDLEERDREAAERRRDLREQREALERQAAAAGFPSPERFSEAARRLIALERRCARFFSIQTERERIEGRVAEASDKARDLAVRLGEPWDDGDPVGSLQRLSERIGRVQGRRRAKEDAEERLRREKARLAELEAEAERLRRSVVEVLDLARIPSGDLEKGLREFAARRERAQRFRLLEEQLIPLQAKQTLRPEELEALRGQVRALEAQIQAEARAHPDWAREVPADSVAEARRRVEELHERSRRLAEERREAGAGVNELLRQWREERPDLAAEREDLVAALERTRRHQRGLEMAVEVLRGVAAVVHAEWAEHLNAEVNALLGSFVPSLGSLRFNEDLSFRVVRAADGARLEGVPGRPIKGALSVGQRDQLHLAVRLGIASFLGARGACLPLLLDDPFVNFDDERFAAAVRFLAERAQGRHQVILFTCHRERFEWLRRLDPARFEARVAWTDFPAP